MPKQPKILIFDSGIGGLSVFDHLCQAVPDANFIYAQDSAWAPYGCRSDKELESRIHSIFGTLIPMKPDVIIIACNTASTFILPSLRAETDIPIIGVIPPIKPGALQSKSKVIGLLATPATVSRPYTDGLIRDFAADCQVLRHGTTALVAMAEAKLSGEAIDIRLLRQEIEPLFKNPKMDLVLLGCTHFPHLKNELEQAAPWPVLWLDSGPAIARRLMSVLKDIQPPEHGDMTRLAFDTAQIDKMKLSPAFRDRGFTKFDPI